MTDILGQALATTPQVRRLVLHHPVFRTFANPYFRLSTPDQLPVFVVQMDDREATLPVPAMMAEFGIKPQDEDGHMLALVMHALEFVTGLEIGDPIPLEVLSGQASWPVDSVHRDLSTTRLNMLLIGRLPGVMQTPAEAIAAIDVHAPIDRDAICAGLERMGQRLGDVPAAEILKRVEALADELAYIEALRDWLLRGAMRMDRVLSRVYRAFSGDYTHREILAQNQRLTAKGILEIEAQFAVVDRLCNDLAGALADPDGSRQVLRRQRDRLYRRWRAWEPFCRDWGATGTRHDTRAWQLTHETYRFLAPRYMTVVEWRTSPRRPEEDPSGRPGMTW